MGRESILSRLGEKPFTLAKENWRLGLCNNPEARKVLVRESNSRLHFQSAITLSLLEIMAQLTSCHEEFKFLAVKILIRSCQSRQLVSRFRVPIVRLAEFI